MAIISAIAAMAHNRVIGKDQAMPWHLPADLRHFKAKTLGKVVVMGRRTYYSIGHALPDRINVVLSRSIDKLPDALVYADISQALSKYKDHDEIVIMGGGHVYAATQHLWQRMYLTLIDVAIDGDCFFPPWLADDWQVVEESFYQADKNNAHNLSFVCLSR